MGDVVGDGQRPKFVDDRGPTTCKEASGMEKKLRLPLKSAWAGRVPGWQAKFSGSSAQVDFHLLCSM